VKNRSDYLAQGEPESNQKELGKEGKRNWKEDFPTTPKKGKKKREEKSAIQGLKSTTRRVGRVRCKRTVVKTRNGNETISLKGGKKGKKTTKAFAARNPTEEE